MSKPFWKNITPEGVEKLRSIGVTDDELRALQALGVDLDIPHTMPPMQAQEVTKDSIDHWLVVHPECRELLPQDWFIEEDYDGSPGIESFGIDYKQAIKLIRLLLADPPVEPEST